MKYIALLRGINVGGNNKVEMKKLREVFEIVGCKNVSTYINSGNVVFEFPQSKKILEEKVGKEFRKSFGFTATILLKTEKEMIAIAKSIPSAWQNNTEYKSDVAYLFPEVDNPRIINDLPVKKGFLEIKYAKGAIIWHLNKKNYNKSQINKLISHRLYKSMTIRNVNTARHLARM